MQNQFRAYVEKLSSIQVKDENGEAIKNQNGQPLKIPNPLADIFELVPASGGPWITCRFLGFDKDDLNCDDFIVVPVNSSWLRQEVQKSCDGTTDLYSVPALYLRDAAYIAVDGGDSLLEDTEEFAVLASLDAGVELTDWEVVWPDHVCATLSMYVKYGRKKWPFYHARICLYWNRVCEYPDEIKNRAFVIKNRSNCIDLDAMQLVVRFHARFRPTGTEKDFVFRFNIPLSISTSKNKYEATPSCSSNVET